MEELFWGGSLPEFSDRLHVVPPDGHVQGDLPHKALLSVSERSNYFAPFMSLL